MQINSNIIETLLVSPVPFAIEESTGIVSVVEALTGYSRRAYVFEAVVTDGRATLATNLTVHVAQGSKTTKRSDLILNMTVQVSEPRAS